MSVTITRAERCVGRPISSDLYKKEGVVTRVSLASNSVWVKFEDSPDEEAFDPDKVTWVNTIPRDFVRAVIDSETYTDDDVPAGEAAGKRFIHFQGYPEVDEVGSVSSLGVGYIPGVDTAVFAVAYNARVIYPLVDVYLPSPWWLVELEERAKFAKP